MEVIEIIKICNSIVRLKNSAASTQDLFPVLQEIDKLKKALDNWEQKLNEKVQSYYEELNSQKNGN